MMMHMGLGKYKDMRIINSASSLLMQTNHVGKEENAGDGYGFGLGTMKHLIEGKTMIGHTGGAYGVVTSMFWNKERTFGIVTMSNGYRNEDSNLPQIYREVSRCLYNNLIKGTDADR
jgi:CubicO group peptidase (beta-lactamase class C family)